MNVKTRSILYAVLFFALYIAQSLCRGLLTGSFGMDRLWAQVFSVLFALVIVGIFLRKKERREYYGIRPFRFQKKYLLLFILPLFNIPYFFMGENESILYAFFGSFFVGFMEELIFRGCFFRGIEEKWGTERAVVISGVVFGLFHMSNIGRVPNYYVALQVIYAGAIGVLFAVIFSMTGSLLLCVGVHFLVDLGAFIGGDNYSIILEVVFTVVCVAVTIWYVMLWKKEERSQCTN